MHDFRFNRNNEPFGYWKWRERGVSMDPTAANTVRIKMNHASPIAAEELEGQCLGLRDDQKIMQI
jgi:hypothetical protein